MATWKRLFGLPWREDGLPNHLDDKLSSDQKIVNKEVSLWSRRDQKLARLGVHDGPRESVQIPKRVINGPVFKNKWPCFQEDEWLYF